MDGSMETESKESSDGGEYRARSNVEKGGGNERLLWKNDSTEWTRTTEAWKQSQRNEVEEIATRWREDKKEWIEKTRRSVGKEGLEKECRQIV